MSYISNFVAMTNLTTEDLHRLRDNLCDLPTTLARDAALRAVQREIQWREDRREADE